MGKYNDFDENFNKIRCSEQFCDCCGESIVEYPLKSCPVVDEYICSDCCDKIKCNNECIIDIHKIR